MTLQPPINPKRTRIRVHQTGHINLGAQEGYIKTTHKKAALEYLALLLFFHAYDGLVRQALGGLIFGLFF